MIFCTIQSKPLALPWGWTPRLDSGVRVNIHIVRAWLRGGHPIINVGDLSIEASRNLGLLLDQLRYPAVKSLSNIVVIVLIKSLSAIAKKRPAFYGRILPVLLGLDPSSAAVKAGNFYPPAGSETLLMQVVQTLTDGAIPSPNLITTIRKLYDTKLRDTEILIPILPFLPKDELLQIFPRFVNLPSDKFQAALARILQESSQGGSILTPAEVLIGIHGIDLEKDGIPLKKASFVFFFFPCPFYI
ncbi:symplekin isoform X1 [Tanacetum coccineum]